MEKGTQMERIENPMVLCRECEEELKVLEWCTCCKDKLFNGSKVYKIMGHYYCQDCVEEEELDADDYF